MKLPFSQGLARYQSDIYATPTFLQKSSPSGEFIDLIVSPDPTIIVFAHKNASYVVEESKTVPRAWGPFTSGGTKYLYWDINLLDASLTRGYTLFPEIVSSTPPQNPPIDQHWFDTTEKQVKVWNGSKWIEKIRVFAAAYSSQAIIQPAPLGTQAGQIGEFEAGNLILDAYNKPLRQSDGTFVTSSTELSIINAASKRVKFEAEIVSGMAAEQIPKYSFVQARPNHRIILARSDDWKSRIIGLVDEDLYQDEVGQIITEGLVRNEQWNWPSTSIGRPVFCGTTGQVTLTPPVVGVNQIAGYVYDTKSIEISIQAVTILADISATVPGLVILPAPIADFSAAPLTGAAPLTVNFTSKSLNAPTTFEWDFKNDGSIDAITPETAYTFTTPGSYSVKLKVTNSIGEDQELKQNFITVTAPQNTGLYTNLGIQLSGPLQVSKSQKFSVQVTLSNDGYKNATAVSRTIIFDNEETELSELPTGSTIKKVNKTLVLSLPVLPSLLSGGHTSNSFSITAPNHSDALKLISIAASPEADNTLSDNTAELTITIKQ